MWTKFKNRLLRQKQPTTDSEDPDSPPSAKNWEEFRRPEVTSKDDRSARSTPERNKRTTIRSRFSFFSKTSPKKEEISLGTKGIVGKKTDVTNAKEDKRLLSNRSSCTSSPKAGISVDLVGGNQSVLIRDIDDTGERRRFSEEKGNVERSDKEVASTREVRRSESSKSRTGKPSFTDYPVWIHRVWNDGEEDDDDDEEESKTTVTPTVTSTPVSGVSTFLERSTHDPLTASCAEKVSPPRLKRRKKTTPMVETESRKSRLSGVSISRPTQDPREQSTRSPADGRGTSTGAPATVVNGAKVVLPPRVPYPLDNGLTVDEFSINLERTLDAVNLTNDENESAGEISPDGTETITDCCGGTGGLPWRNVVSPVLNERSCPGTHLAVLANRKSMQSSPDFTSDDAEGKESGYVTLEDLQAQLARSSWSSDDKESGRGSGSAEMASRDRKGLFLDKNLANGIRDCSSVPATSHSTALQGGLDDDELMTADASSVLQFTFTVKLESKMFRRRAGQSANTPNPGQAKGHEIVAYNGVIGHDERPVAAVVSGTMDYVFITDEMQTPGDIRDRDRTPQDSIKAIMSPPLPLPVSKCDRGSISKTRNQRSVENEVPGVLRQNNTALPSKLKTEPRHRRNNSEAESTTGSPPITSTCTACGNEIKEIYHTVNGLPTNKDAGDTDGMTSPVSASILRQDSIDRDTCPLKFTRKTSGKVPLAERTDNRLNDDHSTDPNMDMHSPPALTEDESYLNSLSKVSDDDVIVSGKSVVCLNCKMAEAMKIEKSDHELTHMNWDEVIEEAKTLGIPLHHPPNITLSTMSDPDRRSSKSSSMSSIAREFGSSASNINRIVLAKGDATPKSKSRSSSASQRKTNTTKPTGSNVVIRDMFRLQNLFSKSNKENRKKPPRRPEEQSDHEGVRHRGRSHPSSSPGTRISSIQGRSLPPPPSPDEDTGLSRSYPSRTSICSRPDSASPCSQTPSRCIETTSRLVGCSTSASTSRSRDYFLEELGGSLGSSWSGDSGGVGGGASRRRQMCVSPSNSSFGSIFSHSSKGSSATPATPLTPATPMEKSRTQSNTGLFGFTKKPIRDSDDFGTGLGQLHNCSWYWGPLSFEEAEQKLANRPDGTFLVRDSSDDRYLLSLSFRSLGTTHHTRIEHYKGMFSFYSQPRSHCSAVTIVEFIEEAMCSSRGGHCLYYLRPRGPGQPPAPVRLVYPLSRFRCMHSLQHLCKFAILRHVRLDLVDRLPIPPRLKEYLKQSQIHAISS